MCHEPCALRKSFVERMENRWCVSISAASKIINKCISAWNEIRVNLTDYRHDDATRQHQISSYFFRATNILEQQRVTLQLRSKSFDTQWANRQRMHKCLLEKKWRPNLDIVRVSRSKSWGRWSVLQPPTMSSAHTYAFAWVACGLTDCTTAISNYIFCWSAVPDSNRFEPIRR